MRSRHRTESAVFPLSALHAVPENDDQSQDAARERHPDDELERGGRRKPQCQGGSQLDVTAAHHADVERRREHGEDADGRPQLDRDAPARGKEIDSQ